MIFIPIIFIVRLLRVRSEKYNWGNWKQQSGNSNSEVRGLNWETELCAKFFIAFAFDDQLTRATESLHALTAFARYGNRSVAVPFEQLSYVVVFDDDSRHPRRPRGSQWGREKV